MVTKLLASNLLTNRSHVDNTLERGYVWQRASFTVPLSTPDAKVLDAASKYQLKFGKHLEGNGYTVLDMTTPVAVEDKVPIDPDRKKYVIFARVKRRPQETSLWVPDNAVNEMRSLGMRLTE